MPTDVNKVFNRPFEVARPGNSILGVLQRRGHIPQGQFSSNPMSVADVMNRVRPGAASSGSPGISTPPNGTSPSGWLDAGKAFFDELMKPLDFNDPLVSSILNSASTGAMSAASDRGIQGGMNVLGGQQAYINAAAGLQQQRHNLAGQILGTGISGANANAENVYGADFNKYIADMQRAGTIPGAIGGVAGTILGGITGIKGLGQAGYNLGTGIGQYGSGITPPSYGGGAG